MSQVSELRLSEITQNFHSEDKKQRLRALETLRDIATEKKKSASELQDIWNTMNNHVARLLTDATESCRNLAVDVVRGFLERLPIIEKNIMYTMTALVRRLASLEILEPSEEVRLNCVSLLRLITSKYRDFLAVYIDDLVAILARTVTDNYPKIKRESSEAICELAAAVPAQFYSKSSAMVKPILSNFAHQHYRVRVASVLAIGAVLQHGNSKLVEEIATPMAERLFDQSAAVRAAVVRVAGGWLVNLRDRYSWWFKLVPLLLTGLHDEIAEVRKEAAELWNAAGLQYLEENKTDDKIKDKMDFLTDFPPHYPPVQRPNLGCRIIAQQNIGKLVGGIARELGDWLPDIRVRSAQLLAVLVLNVEQDIIQHMEKLLPAMYRACNDADLRVVENVILAGEYMGYFVPAEIYCPLVLPTLEDGNITAGHLAVFAAILRGSERESVVDKLQDVGHFLRAPHICRSKKANYQEQVLRCCQALIRVANEDCEIIADDLFLMIVTVWAMAQDVSLQKLSRELMEMLAEVEKQTLEEIYVSHLPQLLTQIKETSQSWTVYSAELYIFKFCLTETKSAAINSVDLLLPMLKDTMHTDSDPELRLKLFILLSDFFSKSAESLSKVKGIKGFVGEFLEEILMPGLIWSVGRASEALRTAAVGCLCALFAPINENNDERFNDSCAKIFAVEFFDDSEQFGGFYDKLRPILLSLVDDNSRKTRLYALQAIYLTLNIASNFNCVTDENVIEIYPTILKRLDDGCNDVRIGAVEALVFVWRALSPDYDVSCGKSHVDYVYTSAIVHLDDPEVEFQQLMLDAMMQLAKIHPELLAHKIEQCKINFRNQKGLEKLLTHCHQLLNT